MTTYSSDRPGAPPAFDQMQVLARALKIGLRTEVRHVDYERITLPMATRVAVPLADAGRQVRASIHDDVALPSLALPDVVEDRDAARSLHDAPETAGRASEFGESAGQAAIRQRAVLRTIMAIHARGVVARRKFGKSRRGRRVIFPAAAGHRLVLACLGRLQQSETKLPIGGGHLLCLRRQRRNPAIGRIDDHRGARAGALLDHEQRIVGTGDVELGPALHPPVAAQQRRSPRIQLGSLCLGQILLVREFGGALKGRVGFVGPNALQIGLAPGGFQSPGP